MLGFNTGSGYLPDLCNNHHIIAIRKHWFSKHNLYKLDNIHSDLNCFIASCMNFAMSAGIWRNGINHLSHVSYIDSDSNSHCESLTVGAVHIIKFCVKFPRMPI